jgi:hypothetical protein
MAPRPQKKFRAGGNMAASSATSPDEIQTLNRDRESKFLSRAAIDIKKKIFCET